MSKIWSDFEQKTNQSEEFKFEDEDDTGDMDTEQIDNLKSALL